MDLERWAQTWRATREAARENRAEDMAAAGLTDEDMEELEIEAGEIYADLEELED